VAKRLQVILQDPEYREISRAARARRMSIAAWVRQALAAARRQQPLGGLDKKLAVIRMAAQHDFPVADVETILGEIERGYASGPKP
jgi:hypothetical protein